ncbi:hypothetical protein LJR230_004163 [Trinickia sp. LjRoot230]|uniref:hypothetical protein n=1 Tax=Trinickia sp. LjRoot230 TaxID=3342288 RepID=UPI003ECD9915
MSHWNIDRVNCAAPYDAQQLSRFATHSPVPVLPLRQPDHAQLAVLRIPRGASPRIARLSEPHILQAKLIEAASQVANLAQLRACVGSSAQKFNGKTTRDLPPSLRAAPLSEAATRLPFIGGQHVADACAIVLSACKELLNEDVDDSSTPLLALAKRAIYLESQGRQDVLQVAVSAWNENKITTGEYAQIISDVAIRQSMMARCEEVSYIESVGLLAAIRPIWRGADESAHTQAWSTLPIVSRNILNAKDRPRIIESIDTVMEAMLNATRERLPYTGRLTLGALAEGILSLPTPDNAKALNRVLEWIESNPADTFYLMDFIDRHQPWSQEQKTEIVERLCRSAPCVADNARALVTLIPDMYPGRQLDAFKTVVNTVPATEWTHVRDELHAVLQLLRHSDYEKARPVFDARDRMPQTPAT